MEKNFVQETVWQENIWKNTKIGSLLLASVLASCAPRVAEQKVLWNEQNPIVVQEGWFENVLDFFTQNFWKNIILPKDAFYFSSWADLVSIYSKNQPRFRCENKTTSSNIAPGMRSFWSSWNYENLKNIFQKNWIDIEDEIVFKSWNYRYYVKLKKLDENTLNFCSVIRR